MKNILLLLGLVIFLSSGCQEESPNIINTLNSKPNILLIIADDMGVEATPGYSIGAVKPAMPNLQSLAARGVTFDNVWSYPVCSPTRASILTGRYGYRTGVLNAEDASTIAPTEKTLQAFLDENTNSSYSHAIVGKWHLSNGEPNRPTEMGVGYYAGLLGGGTNDYNSWPLTENGGSNQYTGYITTKITDLAIEWIGQQTNPWFCWVAYTAPHTPFHLPPNEMHAQGDLPSDIASIEANPTPYFMGMMESFDFEMGRLMESISEDELENTIIIFVGDNGTHPQVIQSPYQMNQSKASLFQGGIHVPMIVAGRGVTRKGTRDDNLIHTADLFATIAEIAGADLPTYEDSYSFNSLLSNSTAGLRTYNYSENKSTNLNKSGYTVRNDRYKLFQLDNGQQRLYDLLTDPYEGNNLLSGTLTSEQETALQELVDKADEIRR